MIQRVLSRFRIWQRIVFLLMTFFIPLGVLGVYSLSGIESYIQFAEKEKIGAAMMRSLNALFAPIAHRASSKRDGSIDETIKDDALKAFNTLNVLWRENQESLNLAGEAETPNELRRRFESVWTNSTPDIQESAKDFISELLKMIRVVGNKTNLILDPDLDSYYLIDTMVNQIPEIHEALMMWEWSKESKASHEEQAQYHGLIQIHLVPSLIANMSSVQKEDKNFYGEKNGLQSQITSWLGTVGQYRLKLTGEGESAHHTELHDFFTSMSESASREIEGLLDVRIQHYKSIRQQAWVYTTLALAFLPIFSVILVRSITTPIYRLIDATCKAAKDGDLAQRVEVSGKDEIAELSLSFNLMVETLDTMVNRVQDSGLVVTNSAKEIAGVAKQQQATSAEIAATTLEIEATSKEISATTKQLSKTMQEVHEVAEGTASLAGEGQEGLIKMRETMQGIMSASGAISSKLSVLNERATKINSVITTITKVADQTNLLSLNAAIEAEKAGEYGQGFAVVAREIRRLADQTAVATFDIEQMVKEMQSSVSTGVMGMERFTDEVKRGVHDVESVSSQLAEIISQVQTLTPRFDSVSEGMQSQVLGAQQISEGLGQLSTAVQQTADSLMQSNHSIERLNEAAGGLQLGVERFKLSQSISR